MSTERKLTTSYIAEIEKLEQLKCWSVIAGEGTGSHIELYFGKKILRKHPLKNPYLSKEVRKFDSEFSLFAEECSWRLESDREVICGSMSENDNDGVMLSGLMRLLNQKVHDVLVLTPSLDLKIEFNNNLRLVLFCNTGSDDDNYSFSSLSNIFIVQGYGQMVVEKKVQGYLSLV